MRECTRQVYLSRSSVICCVLAVVFAPFAGFIASAQTAQPATVASAAPKTDAHAAALARIEAAIEARRKELNIPGMSFAIVKGDEVIYLKGLGVKDFERKVAVTPDTLFAIGSSSKAFTALAAAMSQDEGKLSLDDSPKKFLPYFKLQDPEADAKIVMRDLLSHRSGLNRTDLAWVTGKLTREEIIRVAGQAKPTAKFREKFLYQNVMYGAAGEAVARAQGKSWDDVMRERIFLPLGMTRTVTTIGEMTKSNDYSFGYDYAPATKITRRLPYREFPQMAPAGAINSSARDMTNWLRLMIGGGAFAGKRLVSEAAMAELVKPHIEIAPKIGYGLGWFLREWKGKRVVEHGGNIDGFNALVAFMPEERLGFVMLTNVTSSPLGQTAMEAVWSNLAGYAGANAAQPSSPLAGELQRKTGKYLFAEANLSIDVALADGKLTANVPGQPLYTLQDGGGGRYALTVNGSALPGYFASFRPVKANEAELEMFLEQPQGNFTLARIKPADPKAAGDTMKDTATEGTLRALVGSYTLKEGKANIEIVERDGRVLLVVAGQPSYPLYVREPDVYGATGLPDSYSVKATRDAAGKITGITLRQPQGDFPLTRAASFNAPLTAEELMNKIVAAIGGEAALRNRKSLRQTFAIDFENQGITGTGTTLGSAPNLYRQEVRLTALGKEIAQITETFNGTREVTQTTFSPTDEASGAALDNARLEADFYQPLNWRTLFKTIEITGTKKVGDEECYVVKKTPVAGNAITDYVSTQTFLVMRRDSLQTSSTSEVTLPVTETFSDYRTIDGVRVPFKIVTEQPSIGTIVMRVTEARANVPLTADAFGVPAVTTRNANAAGK